MKSIVIAGRLGKDAELRRTGGGDPVLSFPVAVDDGYGQNKSTMWFDCSVWGKRGEALGEHLRKGTAVAVSGDLSRREHDGKTYLAVRVNDVTLQGGGERQEKQTQQRTSYDDQDDRSNTRELDDEIPF